MKKYLMTDFAAGLALLAIICAGGYYWMDYKFKEVQRAIKEQRIEVVRKEMLANNSTKAERTIFERAVKSTE